MIDHGMDLKTLSVEELKTLKKQYEAQREVYCQEYIVYANNCVEHMDDPIQRDFWDAKIKDLEPATQKYKHLIMDVIREIDGIAVGSGNLEPGKETVK